MARRGAGLADIKTTEELVELLKLEGLHVLNVYSGFFGLCNAIATNLRDFKMVQGGDDLRVTTVNVDQIEVFKRFRNKSEPAYLFVLNGRVINSYYGCNPFALIDLIKHDLELYKSGKPMNRQTFDLREMSALEAQRFRVMREKMISDRMQYQAKKQKIIYDYKMSVTDSIMENVADTGVTVFMPHAFDDELLGNLTEHATRMNMQQKTSIVTQITKLDLEMINFDGKNMSPLLFNHIRDKDVLIVAWKMASVELRPISEVFAEFAKSLRAELDFGKPKAKATKAAKGGKKKKQEKKKEETDENEAENQPFQLPVLPVLVADLQREKADPIQIEPIDLKFIESENDVIKMVSESITTFTEQSIVKIHNECIRGALIGLIDNSKTENVEDAENIENDKKKPKKTAKAKKKPTPAGGDIILDPKDKNKAYVCPVWTPPTPRSHASILYLYFRRLLSFFLPMDPPSALGYVIVAFSASKHEEILQFMADNEHYKSDILAHGFFDGFIDGENFTNAKLICKTGVEYRMGIQQPGDKLILQVSSNTEALLALVDFEPEFVSLNEHDAQIEGDVIFPLGYTSLSEADAELEMMDKQLDGEEETTNEQAPKPEADSQQPEADNADIKNDTNVITE